MGYCIQLIEKKFCIKAQHVPEALEAILDLEPEDYGKSHFSWVSTEGYRTAADFFKAMDEWRYEVLRNEFGDISDIEFTGEKSGDCRILFKTLAPFVEEDSYLQFEGEDGARWGYHFTQGSLTEFLCPKAFDDYDQRRDWM